MERYSILEPKTPQVLPESPDPAAPRNGNGTGAEVRPLRFPGEDGGKSLAEIAQRDLEAALQLLADRAQYITAASGAAIAMRKGDHMVCRASAGPSAPELGAELQVDSGLSGESVRTRQILRCDDAETDPRVNRESCRALGIASVVVLPLLANDEVVGVFELFSSRACAFEERDIVALQRLAEMIQTALENTEAIKRTVKEIAAPAQSSAVAEQVEAKDVEPDAGLPVAPSACPDDSVQDKPAVIQPRTEAKRDEVASPVETRKPGETVEPELTETEKQAEPAAPAFVVHGVIRKCEKCGFPVSHGRTICLDCEKAQKSGGQPKDAAINPAPAFLSELDAGDESWISSHKYLLAIVLMALIAVAVLVWMR